MAEKTKQEPAQKPKQGPNYDNEYEFDETIFDVDIIGHSKQGRGTKCTEELIKEIAVRIARDGSTYTEAAILSGIHKVTFHSWMRRGRKEQMRLKALGVEDESKELVKPRELPYLLFFETINKAVPMRKALLVNRIHKAGEDPRNWTANAWLLERMHPDEFGRKTRLEISKVPWRDEVITLIKQGVPFNVVADKIGDGEARELFDRAGVEISGSGASEPPQN